jgi:hypothetical protein
VMSLLRLLPTPVPSTFPDRASTDVERPRYSTVAKTFLKQGAHPPLELWTKPSGPNAQVSKFLTHSCFKNAKTGHLPAAALDVPVRKI